MTAYTSIEERLLLAAEASDLPAIINIVSSLSIKEKESVGTNVFDAVLHSIAHHARIDQAESAYTTMVFIRAVGHYTSPAAVNDMLQATRPVACALRRRVTDFPLQTDGQIQQVS